MDVGTLLMEVKANTSNFDKKMGGVNKVLGKVSKAAVIGGTAITAAAGGLVAMATKSAATTDRIDKLSQRLGMSKKGFQEWDFILSQSGTSVESLQSGMKVMVQGMTDLEEGTGKGAEAFKKLGISYSDIKDISQEDVFKLTVERFNDMEDGAKKAGIAQDLFSRSGQELLPLLNSNAGAIDEMTKKANDLGLVLSDDAVNAGVSFTDTIDQLKRSLGKAGTEIGTTLIPIFENLSELIIANMPTIQSISEKTFGVLTAVVKTTWDILNSYFMPILNIMFDFIKESFPIMQEIATTVFNKITKVGTVLSNFYKENLLPILEELFGSTKDNFPVMESIITTVFDKIEEVAKTLWDFYKENLLPIHEKMFKSIKENMPLIKGIYTNAFKSIWSATNLVWNILKVTLLPILKIVFNYINDNWDTIETVFAGAFKGINFAIKTVSNTLETLVGWLQNAYNWLGKFFSKKSAGSLSLPSEPSPSNRFGGNFGGRIGGQRAFGGSVRAGESYLVGERGAETFTPSVNGTIGAAAGNVTININGTTDPNIIMHKVVQTLRQNNIINR